MPTTISHTPARLFPHCSRQPNRHGSLYLAVLGVAMIVSVIGMSAMVVARLNLRSVGGRQDRREARLLADAAVELGTGIVMQDANWRTIFQNGQVYPSTPMTMGNGTITWKLVDTDSDLAGDDTDPVRLYGIGRVGQSVYTKSVLLEPAGQGLSSLEVSMHAGLQILVGGGTLNSDQRISANNSVEAFNTTVNADVEAVFSVSGGTYNGTTTQGIPPRQMPNPASVFDLYLTKGTVINVNDLPKWGGSPALQFQLLSPANNPYGSGQTNTQGIYIIDLQGAVLWIKNSRIVGTLVLLNPGRVEVYTDVNWEPAVTNYPAMLVDGDLTFQINSTTTFGENSINLNPPGTPYEGEEDNVQDDNYPSIVKGLVYASDMVHIKFGSAAVDGVLVAGNTVDIDNNLNLTYRDVFLNNPPPGFRHGDVMTISPGSWRREVSD